MTDELRNMMHGAGEAKARQFTAEDFAAVYGHAVFGRVRRRRAVRAVGVGSASVLGVGVIAVGGMNLPRFTAGLGFGSGPSDSVVCTTAGAEQGWVSLVQTEEGRHNAEFADWGVSIEYVGEGLTIVDSQSDGDVTVVVVNPAPSVIYDGGQDVLRQHDDGTYTLPLPGERVVTLRVIPHEQPDDIEAVTADYRSPTVEVAVGDSGVPAVTCVTTPPQPSASASPMPTVSTSLLPEPSPADTDLSWTWDPADPLHSPFQCGFEFPSGLRETDELIIVGGLTTQADVRQRLVEWYGEQPPATEVGETNEIAYRVSVDFDGASYSAGVLDPVAIVESDKAFGIAFVAVTDGTVVGTIDPASQGVTYGQVDEPGTTDGPIQAFLWDRSAFIPCATTVEGDAEIYAVVGTKTGDNVDYAWSRVTE